MATRQYIGARYVLKVYTNSQDPSSAEWESGVVYEPLTMVTYQNSSYVSRSQVPASAGNPAVATTYWAITGAYNGQIASLQNQIDAINLALSSIEDTLDTIPFPRIYGKSIGVYGDSWSAASPYNAWVTALFTILGNNADNFNVSGSGRSFSNIRSAVEADGTHTADIYIINGGNNDWVQQRNLDDIRTDINAIITAIRNKSPNAEIYFMLPPKYMQWDSTNWGQQYIPLTIYRLTISSVINHTCGVIDCDIVPRFKMDATRNHYDSSLAGILAASMASQINAGGVEPPTCEKTTLINDFGNCYFDGRKMSAKIQYIEVNTGNISITHSKYNSHNLVTQNLIGFTTKAASRVWPYTYTPGAAGISGSWFDDLTFTGTVNTYYFAGYDVLFLTEW